MVDFSPGVAVPPTSSYAAPFVNFGLLGGLGDDYEQGRENKFKEEQRQRARLLQQPINESDPQAVVREVLARGGAPYAAAFVPFLQDQMMRQQAAQPSPFFSGQGGQPTAVASAPSGDLPPASAAAARPTTSPDATPATHRGGDAGTGTIVDIVTDTMPQNSTKTGVVIGNIAKAVGIDPNAPLSPDQQGRVQRLVQAYARRTASAPNGADSVSIAPTAPAARVAGGFNALPQAAGVPPGAVPQAAPQPQAQPQPSQPLVPQYPLPVNPKTGRPFANAQEAVFAIDDEIARIARSGNPYLQKQIPVLEDKRDRIAAMAAPVKVAPGTTYADPATGQPIYSTAATMSAPALEAAAERYRQTGTLPPNMGRGVQGVAESNAIQARAAELELEAGGNPADWATRWQDYRAKGVGKSAAERTRAGREENLKLVLKAANAAIPAALEQSEKVWRSGFVPLNKIVQQGQVVTSDPELRAFGMANLQLAEHWARAMNPTGVMRESDRDLALGFLSTADSPSTYRRLVGQLKTQIEREYNSIRSGDSAFDSPQQAIQQLASASSPSGGTSSQPAKDGWVTLPNGVRIREVK